VTGAGEATVKLIDYDDCVVAAVAPQSADDHITALGIHDAAFVGAVGSPGARPAVVAALRATWSREGSMMFVCGVCVCVCVCVCALASRPVQMLMLRSCGLCAVAPHACCCASAGRHSWPTLVCSVRVYVRDSVATKSRGPAAHRVRHAFGASTRRQQRRMRATEQLLLAWFHMPQSLCHRVRFCVRLYACVRMCRTTPAAVREGKRERPTAHTTIVLVGRQSGSRSRPS
jgi:hypothetical protein